MCCVCEKPCWRDGGEGECPMTDEEFEDAMNELEKASGVIDLMERLQYSLRADKRRPASPRSATPEDGESTTRSGRVHKDGGEE